MIICALTNEASVCVYIQTFNCPTKFGAPFVQYKPKDLNFTDCCLLKWPSEVNVHGIGTIMWRLHQL